MTFHGHSNEIREHVNEFVYINGAWPEPKPKPKSRTTLAFSFPISHYANGGVTQQAKHLAKQSALRVNCTGKWETGKFSF